jgi:hypothetical protein
MLWITLPNDILVQLSMKYFASSFSPHITFASLPIEYALDFKVVWRCLAIYWGEFGIHGLLWTNFFGGPPTNAFSSHWWNLALESAYIDGVISCMCMASPQSHTPMYTTFGLYVINYNMMLSLDKSLWKIPEWCITFIMFINVRAYFKQFHLKVTNLVRFSIFDPPCRNINIWLSKMGEYFML